MIPNCSSEPAREEIHARFWRRVYSRNEASSSLADLQAHPWLSDYPSPKVGSLDVAPYLVAVADWGDDDLVQAAVAGAASLEYRDSSGRTGLRAVLESAATASDPSFRYRLAERLIDRGARCDVVGHDGMPLWAVNRGDVPVHLVNRFLDGGAPIDCVDDAGNSFLSDLIRNGSKTSRESLFAVLERGADVNFFSRADIAKLPLVVALSKGFFDVAEELLRYGADVRRKDRLSSTPLHVASTGEMVRWLIDHGADVNGVDALGSTPLHRAIERSCLERTQSSSGEAKASVVVALMAAGANLDARDAAQPPLWPRQEVRDGGRAHPRVKAALRSIEARQAGMEALSFASMRVGAGR